MPIMRVRGIGSKGVVKDLPSFELPPEAWSDAKNVRFIANRIEKMGGYFPVLTDGMPDEPPLAILTRNNTQDQIYGTKEHIYMVNGRQHLNVSKKSVNPAWFADEVRNPKYDPNQEIPNPAYDNRETISNPNFDTSKPVDENETIDDPNNPGTEIPNPDYNPARVPNPKYDNRETIANPDYDPVEKIPNPDKPDDYDPATPQFIDYKYNATPESTWYYTTLSNAVVMNTPLENPQGLVPYKDAFEEIPGWGWPSKNKRPDPENPKERPPRDWKAGRVRSYRNYLVALDMTEGGVNLPQRVRWSNVAYVNELPPDWIEDDEARDGGFNDLTDANGKIVDGMPLRDSFVIYTDQETYLMEYVGGILIFQFKKLFSDTGILAPECAVEFEQKHFVIAKDDIFVHNGSSKQPVAAGRIKQFLIDEISSVNPQATKVFAYTPQKEIWITYVGPGQTWSNEAGGPDNDHDILWQCNKCAVWNWEWDTWYFFDLPSSYDVNMAPPPDLITKEWDDYSDPDVDYWGSAEMEHERWSELGKDFIKRVPYVASPDRCLYTVDVGQNQVTWTEVLNPDGSHSGFVEKTSPVVAEMYRSHLDMDEAVENTRSHKFIRHITPQFRGEGSIHCYVGGSPNPTQEPTWDNWQIFDIEEDVKIDAFSNNRYPAIKFSDFGQGEWSFQGYDIDFVVEGIR